MKRIESYVGTLKAEGDSLEESPRIRRRDGSDDLSNNSELTPLLKLFSEVIKEIYPDMDLNATLNYHLESKRSQKVLEIRRNLYVASVILSTSGKSEALEKYHEVKSIFEEAAMNIREFLSNDENLNKAILEYDQISVEVLQTMMEPWMTLMTITCAE
uniref:KIF-binding protein n=1 Tax=Loa loa TaxID=7209 RepID=A0A1I7VV58_LOALO